MSAKKWFAGIFSILLLIAPAFTQNRGEPGKNPPPDQPGNPPPTPPENPPGNPPKRPDKPGPHGNKDFYNFRGYRKIIINDSIEVVNAYIATSSATLKMKMKLLSACILIRA